MRSDTRMRQWTIGAMAAAAALGFGGLALAQHDNAGDRHERRVEMRMTPPQVAALVKNTQRSLIDSITVAEKHSGGRAVRAECCGPADASGGGAICMITLLVGEDRLVETAVDLQTGAVVSQRDVDSIGHFGVQKNEFAMARSWQKSSDLMGKHVTNPAKEDLGKIEDIVVDAGSGRILYGVLSFGGVLGMGDKLFALPWQTLPLSGDAATFVLNVDKDRLTKAAAFDQSHWPDFADEQFLTATYKYYNQTPYWHSQKGNVRRASDKDGRTATHYRDRWIQRPTLWQKASDLCGKDVRNNQNEELGKLNDLVIDPQGGRILYGILSSNDKLFAIPWCALNLSDDYKQLVVNVTKDQLKDSISFGKDNWPNMADERWATDTYTYYNVQPYWIDVQVERPTEMP